MWKKTAAVLLLGSVILAGCNNDNNDNDTTPDKDETPMEDIREGTDEIREDTQKIVPDGNTGYPNDVTPPEVDQNQPQDQDIMKDSNTNREDIVEDEVDRKDQDNIDR